MDSYESAVDPDFIAPNPERIHTFSKQLKSIPARVGYHATPGARLLDVGCAGGAFLEQRAIRASLLPASVQGILMNGLFPGEAFDVITLWDVIEHVAQPTGLLAIIHGLTIAAR